MPLGVEATSFSVSQIPKGSDGWPTMYLLESPPNPQHTAHVSCITLIGCMLSLVSYWERCRTYGRILVSYHQRGMISSNFFFRKLLFQFTLYYFFCFYSTILFVVSFFPSFSEHFHFPFPSLYPWMISVIECSLLEPCTGCAAPYGFINAMPLSTNTDSFAVRKSPYHLHFFHFRFWKEILRYLGNLNG